MSKGKRRGLFLFPLLEAAPFFCPDGMISSLPAPEGGWNPRLMGGARPPGGLNFPSPARWPPTS